MEGSDGSWKVYVVVERGWLNVFERVCWWLVYCRVMLILKKTDNKNYTVRSLHSFCSTVSKAGLFINS